MRQEKNVIFGELLKCWHLAREVKEIFVLYPRVHIGGVGDSREGRGGEETERAIAHFF